MNRFAGSTNAFFLEHLPVLDTLARNSLQYGLVHFIFYNMNEFIQEPG